VWVNTHGSFPLGLVAIGLLALGARLDGQPTVKELRALRWATVGIVAGGLLNPVGPQLLVFPVTMLARRDVLANVAEWQSPSFTDTSSRVFLLAALAAVVLLVTYVPWFTLGAVTP
jgi:hypothetical protein